MYKVKCARTSNTIHSMCSPFVLFCNFFFRSFNFRSSVPNAMPDGLPLFVVRDLYLYLFSYFLLVFRVRSFRAKFVRLKKYNVLYMSHVCSRKSARRMIQFATKCIEIIVTWTYFRINLLTSNACVTLKTCNYNVYFVRLSHIVAQLTVWLATNDHSHYARRYCSPHNQIENDWSRV